MPDLQSELSVSLLLETRTVTLRDVRCTGQCRHLSAEECARATHLVFPYRGLYLRHVGREQSVADANHVLFFNADEPYRVSHPLGGGDECLSLSLAEAVLEEAAPAASLSRGAGLRFRGQQQRIDARAQALVAILRHTLQNDGIEPFEAENLLLTLVSRCLGPRTSHQPGATHSKRRLVDRVKILLAGDLSRRWTLADIAAEIGGSPVYLTQVFRQVEGVPLYRYHLQLRLARALDLIAGYDDLCELGVDLGFSSHSHFTAAFRQAFGRSPSAFKQSASPRRASNH